MTAPTPAIRSEAADAADFSKIRYAQCWEDADILLEGLAIRPGDTCLSIASAGDNALAMLARGPARVIALDLNPAQIHCLELRVAAYHRLEHPELLELVGSRPSSRRMTLYQKCRDNLSPGARAFWERNQPAIRAGIGGAGKFENYFRLFRERLLPLVHSRRTIDDLLQSRDRESRFEFYNRRWNNLRWQLLFRLFFSRFMMGRLGRDPAFFRYVEGNVATKILDRTRHALTELEPAENPYLQWILTGRHTTALPFALRPENFEAIRGNLDALEWRLQSIEDFVSSEEDVRIDRFNLSDIFEYMSEENFHRLLETLLKVATPGARLAYWNMLAPRRSPDHMRPRLLPLQEESEKLHRLDKAFFYSAFVLEEVK